jgi:hypothetical protein
VENRMTISMLSSEYLINNVKYNWQTNNNQNNQN